MKINQFDICLADLSPAHGTEPGKTRPVIIIQSNLLNDFHSSTVICPISSRIIQDGEPLRLRLKNGQLAKPSDVLVDQMRSIDNRRLIKKIGKLSKEQIFVLKENIRIVLDL